LQKFGSPIPEREKGGEGEKGGRRGRGKPLSLGKRIRKFAKRRNPGGIVVLKDVFVRIEKKEALLGPAEWG